MKYAKVCILKRPGAFDEPLTYHVPSSLRQCCQVGQGVLVPLRNKTVRGIIVSLVSELPEAIETLQTVEDILPQLTLSPESVDLARRLSGYYHCSLLRALKLFVPTTLWQGKGKRLLAQIEKADYHEADPALFPMKDLTHTLTPEQQSVFDQMRVEKRPILLHGVTGSGKTELYLRLILDAVQKGKQAVLLVPEIALTPQMIAYFERYFGRHLALFHSKLSAGQRLDQWFKIKTGHAPLLIGSRSALFAPFRNLGVVIMDEEHEWTYKQESSPYYESHRVAELLREMTGCRLIFGTATPRLETLHQGLQGTYALLRLEHRVNAFAPPRIQVVDLREEFKKRNFSIFSDLLHRKIRERLDRKEQIILFVNQRGMARAVMCRDCGQALTCPECEVSLKLHGGAFGSKQYLLCHYCSYKSDPLLNCPHCGSVNIRHAGVGTERVEEELFKVFPEARVLRADKDSTSDKHGFEPMYQAFKKGEYDILVGTQMVAKGLDFPRVTLVGIMLADIGLHVPDFRSHERLFHLITQVSGRAGRGDIQGDVILQTYQPEHYAIAMAADYAYDTFARQELGFRERLKYPPYSHLVKFIVSGSDQKKLLQHLEQEKELLEDIFKVNDLSVAVTMAPAMVPKVGPNYHWHLLLKGPDSRAVFDHWVPPKGWRVDVDPVHTT